MSAKILIADDEPNLLLALEFLLQREGYQVLLARDGQQAIDLIRQQRPALALLDVTMPLKSGFDVCAEVRSSDETAGTRVVMLTAKGREADMAKGLALGADAYLTKPFSTRELVERVRGLLGPDA